MNQSPSHPEAGDYPLHDRSQALLAQWPYDHIYTYGKARFLVDVDSWVHAFFHPSDEVRIGLLPMSPHAPLTLTLRWTDMGWIPGAVEGREIISVDQDLHIPEGYGIYRRLRELPEAVRKLPISQQRLWRLAFNAALHYYRDEGKAHATAWAVVNRAKKRRSK